MDHYMHFESIRTGMRTQNKFKDGDKSAGQV
jgi:hypothetical protein